ncbi:MAG: hypothetical protein EHM59_16685, partial [Betaproteobacteria bacterium]
PETLSLFARKYPKVRVTLQHGNPAQIRESLIAGSADIGVTPRILPESPDIAALKCREHRRIVLAPSDHALTRKRECSLRDIAKHPHRIRPMRRSPLVDCDTERRGRMPQPSFRHPRPLFPGGPNRCINRAWPPTGAPLSPSARSRT